MGNGTAVKVRLRWFGQQIAFLVLLLLTAGSAWGAEATINGSFTGSTNWTFTTATYDSTVGRAALGSAKVTAGRNATVSGTAVQAVSIPAGSTIDTVALYSQLTTSSEAAGDNVNVTLRYADSTTVTILSTGELTNSSWTQRSASPALVLGQAVNQVTVTLTTRGGSTTGATASLWVDDLTISYTPYTPTSDPLLHNSINLGTKYWSATGWGIAGGQYGAITCATCHTRTTSNIKRVAGTIVAPNSPTNNFPGSTVVFKNVTAFGNDDSGHTTSQRVCEVCHTQTSVHRYDQTTGDLNHKNANLTDCTSCHAHNKSFGASCNTCHGYPPINATVGTDGLASPATGILTSGQAGAHDKHVNVRGMTCETCHQGYTQNPMGNQHIEFGFNINSDTISNYKGTFSGGTFASKTPYAPYSSNTTYAGTSVAMATGNTNNCSNVFCHGGYAGSGGSNSAPSWTDTATAAGGCGACHGVSQATPPTTGSHLRHTGTAAANMNIGCSDCHGTMPADNSHVRGNVVTMLNPASKLRANATYKGFANQSSVALSYGNCTVYCHSTVQTADAGAVATPTISPKWGDPAFVSCDTSVCHGNPPANGAHATHASLSYGCDLCHSTAGKDTAKHADYTIDVAFSGTAAGGAYTQSAANPPGNGYGNCSNIYCHGAGTSIGWNGSLADAAECDSCHGGNKSATATSGYGPIASGVHAAHIANADANLATFACGRCHASTVTTGNDRVVTGALHVNGSANVVYDSLNSGMTYTGPTTCSSNTYCHSTGKGSAGQAVDWNVASSLGCNGCHGSTGNGSGMPTPDAVGVNSHTKHLPTQDTTKCVFCHRTTVNSTNAIIAGSQHLNVVRDARMKKPNTFAAYSGAYNAAARTCSATYCHGGTSGASDAWGTAGPLACNRCHDSSNALPGAHGIHYNSATVVTGLYGAVPGSSSQSATAYQFACAACHGTDTNAHADYPKSAVSDATIFFGFSSAGRGAAATTAYVRQATGSTDSKGFKWTAGGNGNCTATYCHSNGRGSNGGSTSVNWSLTARDASCATCHGNATTTIAGSNPTTTPTMLSGAHKAHIGSVSTGGSFACTACHANTLSGDTAIAATSFNKHVNKFVDYSGLYAGKNKTCSTFYCHSNGRGGTPVTAIPAWTSGTTLGCNGCHGSTGNGSGMPTPDAVGVNSHTRHLPTQDTTKCVFCHRTTVNGTNAIITGSQHINAARDVRFSKPSSFTSYSGSYAAAARTCSATYCHGSAASDAWGTAGPLACNRCHDSSNALPGAHGIHYNSATVVTGLYGAVPGSSSQSATAYQFACAACHGTDTNAHADYPKSAVSDATIFFGFSSAGRGAAATTAYVRQATGSTDSKGFKWTAGGNGNCTATYCHSNGRGSNGGSSSVNWSLTARDASCATCHGNATTTIAGSNPTTTPTMLSGAHKAHIGSVSTGGGFACIDCHATTVSSDTVIAATRFNKHVNKFVDYSGLYAGRNKTCANIYCHSNGRGTAVNPPNWTSGSLLDCSGCHGSTSANLTSGSHGAHLTAGATCQNCHWNTSQATGAIVSVAQHINKTIGVNQGSTFKSLSVTFGGTTSCSTVSCHSSGKFTAQTVTWGTTLGCDGCHPLANLSAAHARHMGSLTASDVSFYSYTGNHSLNAAEGTPVKYGFGCANCHPVGPTAEATYHINGTVEVTVDAASGGTYASALRKLNTTGTAGYVSGTGCDLVYCHSDGKNTMVANGNGHAPAWNYVFTAAERCSRCHGNSPQTAAHDVHQVGIHYNDIYTGTSGKLAAAATGASSHGAAAQSTTITCSTCHYKTVTTTANDQNTLCKTCHTTGHLQGDMKIGNLSFHVNGKKEISFKPSLQVISKAQLREASFPNYSGLWKRNVAISNYKKDATSFDTAKVALTDTMWNSAAGTCSNIVCHNLRGGATVTWTDTTINCVSCHSKL